MRRASVIWGRARSWPPRTRPALTPLSRLSETALKLKRSPRGHSFFFARDFDGNLIELMDLGYMYYVLGWLGPLGGWIFRRGMYKKYYELRLKTDTTSAS